MATDIYEVEYKVLDYSKLDFFEGGVLEEFWEQVIEEFEGMSGESGTFIHLPTREEALDRFSHYGKKAVNTLRKFGDKYGWNKDYFIG